MSAGDKQADRKARLAERLRDNLKRRKAQARQRATRAKGERDGGANKP